MYGHLLFSIPCRYFPELFQVCEKMLLRPEMQRRPLFVVTMKRGFLLENSIGEFGEFERGDQFLFIDGDLPWKEDVFDELPPMPEAIIQECLWEGIDCGICHVAIDEKLRRDLVHILTGLSTSMAASENDWLRIERVERYLQMNRQQDRDIN